MAELIPADFDFDRYMHDTDAAVKVRPASIFSEELRAEFAERKRGAREPKMFSTKLGRCIEFRPGEVTCWAGYNGHRKSMFTGQVALDLCVQRERVLLASFEMRPASTLARMARQAFGVAAPPPAALEHFSRWSDGRLWIFDHLGRITPALCVAVCRYFAEELKGMQVVIDSMMMVCKSEESLDEQKQLVTDLVRLAQETSLHVHLVTHCRKPQTGDEKLPTKYDLRGSAAISDQAHNVITVWQNRSKKAALQLPPTNEKHIKALEEPDAVVAVEKQRNGQWEGKLQLWFDEHSFRFMDDRISAVEPYVLEAA